MSLLMSVNLPDGSSLGRTKKILRKISDQLSKIDGIKNVIANTCFAVVFVLFLFVVLQTWQV